ELVPCRTPKELMKQHHSFTAQYLSPKKFIPLPPHPPISHPTFIQIKPPNQNNLKNLNLKIPLRLFIPLTPLSPS
ncbi:hypothetical protein, partial [Siminovitchia fortis]|uniref:hypothetical protein n=1 Tax=Siminovitchia fortis TaxID=254758 RepID=UPI001C92BB09